MKRHWVIEVVRRDTREVVKSIDCSYSRSKAEKVFDSILTTLDIDNFFVQFKPEKDEGEVSA